MTIQEQRPAAMAARIDRWTDLVRPDRVHRTLYTETQVFAEEMVKVFGGESWVYLAHESQLPQPNAFVSVRMGLRPVLVTRDRHGGLHAIFNRCAHRAATVCREESGTAKSFQCPYHGWTFKNNGELVGVPWPQGYGEMDRAEFGLTRVTRVESYRGFVFGTMNADAPSVEEWLGHARPWLDHWLDRAPEGEVLLGSAAYRMGFRGNWKLAYDNAGDGYHPSFSHRSLLEMASRMGESKDMSYFGRTPDDGPMVSYSLGNGHSVIDQRPAHGDEPGSFWRNQRPQPGREFFEESIRAEHGDDADRLLDLAIGAQINLSIFPNLLIIGNQIQVIEPLAVDRTQLTWHATRIGGVPDEVSILRMRTQEDFPAFGEPDDQANFEEAQRGLAAPEAEWILMNRGLDVTEWQSLVDGVIVTAVTDELHMRSYYDEWLRRMREEVR
ncbi:Ring hydroxylating alpha subunit (catalytic domain) [Geodermatophilus sabuli]|uniref:Ring hydroxylating alpha subunit (Catalytic domain) n=2 Tax=Geodermatophilus sabuli TaxID=1564158 RepID=A0A285EDT1_9ACTN|nr:Ring hydroxylating alpha subunit (catalytic domain) [Geodermatophilus sabuli]